jgi:hypothetical protein
VADETAVVLDLLGWPLPANLADRYYDVRPLIDTTIYERTVAASYTDSAREHHALADAQA